MFKSIVHNTAFKVPFSLGLFFFFLCFPLRVVDKKKTVKQQTSQSYVARGHWNAGDRCPLLIKGTFTFNMELLDLPLSCRDVQVSSFGRPDLDDFLRASRSPHVSLHNTVCSGSSVTWIPDSNR